MKIKSLPPAPSHLTPLAKGIGVSTGDNFPHTRGNMKVEPTPLCSAHIINTYFTLPSSKEYLPPFFIAV